MKLLLTLSLLLLALICYSQRIEPQKGDNIVIISTTDSLPVAFRKLQRLLIDSGYAITSKDAEFYSLQTDYLPIARTDVKMQITSNIREIEGGLHHIVLQGKYTISALLTGGELDGIACFVGMAGGANKLCYRTLSDVAAKYGGYVLYDKR